MKIGIIVYSYTGNTFSVSEKIRTKLEQKGHTVEVKRITAKNDNPNTQQMIQLLDNPSLDGYDRVVLGTPVNGFAPAGVMQEFLKNRTDLAHQTVDLFVTHFFPFRFLGGNQSVERMRRDCQASGATIGRSGVINWSSANRERAINALAEQFSSFEL
ncbi:MAG: hypothetical protein PHC86_05235 [Eubacteriales bacterium]|nr:hypothetical protein [Eubacteriales bacterium]